MMKKFILTVAATCLTSPLALAWGESDRAACDALAARAAQGFEDLLRYTEHHISHFNYKGKDLWQIEVPKLMRQVAVSGNVNECTPGGFTPLQVACYYADKDLVEILLKNGADADARPAGWRGYGFPGDSPVALCVRGMTAETADARVEIVKLLLAHGADPDADMMHWVWGGSAPVTPFCYLGDEPYNNAMRLALLQGSKTDLRMRSRTWEMTWALYSPEVIRALLEGGVSPNRSSGAKGETLLLHLLRIGDAELLKLALDKGADVREGRALKLYHGGYLFAIPADENASPEKAVELAALLVKAKADLKGTFNGMSLYGFYCNMNTPAARALCKFFESKGIRR